MNPAKSIEVRPVESKDDWKSFINLPWQVYQKQSHWVPPLKIAVKDLLNVDKNPFFRHAVMYPLIAIRDGKVVGRIVGIVDENHNKHCSEQTAFFGFFESVEDPQVANALLDEVSKWAKTWGMNCLRGPVNLNTYNEIGVLVDGFQDTPAVMMNYNPPYYSNLLENFGMTKKKDVYAYILDGRGSRFSEKLLSHAERLKTRHKIRFREVDFSRFKEEVELIMEIYNDAWQNNWGFVPLEEDEIWHLAKELKPITDPRLVFIAEVNGEPAGFSLTVPDVNQVLYGIHDGKLFPTGLAKLLWNLKGPGRKKTMNRVRIIALGFKKKFEGLAIGPLLYAEYYRRSVQLGYRYGEASWILEDNAAMNKALERMHGKRYKTYRIYEKPISLAH